MVIVKVIAVLFMVIGIFALTTGVQGHVKTTQVVCLVRAGVGASVLFSSGCVVVGFLFSLLISMGAVIVVLTAIHRAKAPTWSNPLRGLLTCIVVFFSLISIGTRMSGCEQGAARRKTMSRHSTLLKALMRYRGEVLAEKFSGRTALILDDPRYRSSSDNAGMAAFRKAVGRRLSLVEPKVNLFTGPIPIGTIRPPYAPEKFDEMLDSRDDYDLVISFIGLPPDHDRMRFWDQADDSRPDIVLLNRTVPDLEEMLRTGRIAGVFIANPQMSGFEMTDMDKLTPEEYAKKTIFFVTTDTLDATMKMFPAAFGGK